MVVDSSEQQHKLSRVLSRQENESVIHAFGPKCKVEAVAVVQMFMTEPPHNNSWIKNAVGVATLTRDEDRRGYFIQVLDLEGSLVVFEQEVYREFEYHSDVPFFHQFEGEDRMIGLNFADEGDASYFGVSVSRLLNNRKKRREERQRKLIQEEAEKLNLLVQKKKQQEQQQEQDKHEKKGRHERLKEKTLTMRIRLKKKEKKKASNFRSMVISEPYNFEHVSHAGVSDIDKDLESLFVKAGLDKKALENKETRTFVYGYLEENGGLEQARKASKKYSLYNSQKPNTPTTTTHNQVPTITTTTTRHPQLPPKVTGGRSRSSSSISSSSSSSHDPPLPPLPIYHRPAPVPTPLPPTYNHPHSSSSSTSKNDVLPPTPPPARKPYTSSSSSLSSLSSSSLVTDVSSYSIPPPPPPHSSSSSSQYSHPPPPPLPSSSSSSSHPPRRILPSAPKPVSSSSSAPPPPPPLPSVPGFTAPPPPPPLPSGPPAPPAPPPSAAQEGGDPRGALFQQIRNGGPKALKKTTPLPPPPPPAAASSSSSSSSGDCRNQLLRDIRSKGLKLNHVEVNQEPEKLCELEGMALGLQQALRDIFQAVHSDSDDSCDDDDEYDDDDEWD